MLEKWENAIISKIALAMRVPRDRGKAVHTDRPFHGFVLNEAHAEKDYIFSDGHIMHTAGNAFFYLPKGSSYRVRSLHDGIEENACYAINFDADIADEPFVLQPKNTEPLFKCFSYATMLWNERAPYYNILIRKTLYEMLAYLIKEQQRAYVPSGKERLIAPALAQIRSSFTQNDLSVAHLSKMCGISEAYFRRIFINLFGVSPKEYISELRISYAKQLLASHEIAVSSVATMCGYAEPCHFSREFTKRVGVPPTKYKN